VRRQRLAITGQSRTLDERWHAAFGSWGGVRPLDEIAFRVGLEKSVVRDHAKGMNLRTATRRHRRTHAELAVLLYADHTAPVAESCARHGVLRAERALLVGHLQALLDTHGVEFTELLRWPIDVLERAWSDAGMSVEPPVPPRSSTTNLDALRAMGCSEGFASLSAVQRALRTSSKRR
jgi:hypothetical protein